jgi:hypothetical protein
MTAVTYELALFTAVIDACAAHADHAGNSLSSVSSSPS